jgi:hypothetical protein
VQKGAFYQLYAVFLQKQHFSFFTTQQQKSASSFICFFTSLLDKTSMSKWFNDLSPDDIALLDSISENAISSVKRLTDETVKEVTCMKLFLVC